MEKGCSMKRIFVLLIALFSMLQLQAQWNTKRLLEIGKNAIYFDDYVSAIENFNNIIRLKPYLAEPYFFRGLAKLGLDDYEGATKDFTAAIESSPNYFHAYMYRGIAYHNMMKYQEALNDYNQAIQLDPSDAYVYANRGITYAEMGDNKLAEEDFSKSLFIDNKQLSAYLNRAMIREKMKNPEGAMADCNAAIKLNMFSDDAYGLRGYLWFQQKEYHNAIDDYNHALKANPKNMRVLMSRAMTWYAMKDYEKTQADYDKAIEIDSNYLFAYYNRALLRAELGDNNRAIADLDRVADLNPENILVYFNRAMLKREINDKIGAYNDLSESIRLYPDFAKAYILRAVVNEELDDSKAAELDRYKANEIMTRYKRMKEGDKDALVDTTANFMRLVDINANIDGLRDIINGRIQDRRVIIELQNAFYFQFISLDSLRSGKYSNYNKYVMNFNQQNNYKPAIALTKQMIHYDHLFVQNEIARLTAIINSSTQNKQTAYLLRGAFYFNQGEYMLAIADFETLLQNEPDNVMALMNLAAAKMAMYAFIEQVDKKEPIVIGEKKTEREKTDYDDVRTIYRKILTLDPDFAYARYNLANSYAKGGDMDQAIAEYTLLINQGGDLAEAYFNRGLLYIYQGDTQRANYDLSKAGELGITDAYNIIKRYCKKKEY